MPEEPEFVFPDDMPEEMKEQIKDQVRHQTLARNADAHQLLGFLTGLSVDDMRALRAILRYSQQDTNVAAFYEGILSVLVAQKEKKCWACGVNHDDELKTLMDSEAPPAPSPEPTPPTANEALVDKPDGSVTVEPFDPAVLLAQADALNVKFLGGRVGPNIPVECKGCGFRSVSFADRALATDCVKCIETTKWG